MNVTGWIICALIAAEVGAFAWFHGYNRGYEAMRKRAVGSLRFSAKLRRANGLTHDERTLAKADVCDEWANRWDR